MFTDKVLFGDATSEVGLHVFFTHLCTTKQASPSIAFTTPPIDEQQRVQKKTFTNWINAHFKKLSEPIIIRDLFVDIADGTSLIRLIELLSGDKLHTESPRVLQRAHKLSNIRNALDYLTKKCKIKLVNINASDVVDGKPSIVLGLIWSIILYFQIEIAQKTWIKTTSMTTEMKVNGCVTAPIAESSTVPNISSRPSIDGTQPAQVAGSGRQALLTWVDQSVGSSSADLNIKVRDFGPSWRDGRAFYTLINRIHPNAIDLETTKDKTNRQKLEYAFQVAETKLGIPRLLDAEDVDVDKPDERSIMTYVAQFVKESARVVETKEETKKSGVSAKKRKSVTKGTAGNAKTAVPAKEETRTKSSTNKLSPTTQASLEPDPDIDPSLILSASTTIGSLVSRRPRRVSYGGIESMNDEAIRSLILATTPPGSMDGSLSPPGDMHNIGSLSASLPSRMPGGSRSSTPSYPASPHRNVRAKSYAGLRLCRAARNTPKCRAMAKIRVTAEPPKATRNIVPVLHLEDESNTAKEQAEKERTFLITIKELIARVRHNPIEAQDFFTEFETLIQAQLEHDNLTAYMLELTERKRQGLLLGLRPEELDRVEAEWIRVKPELDEWRWRLDKALPGEWCQIGSWLSQAERRLITDADVAAELGLEMAPGAASLTPAERYERLNKCLAEHEEVFKAQDEIKVLFGRLRKKNDQLNELAQAAAGDPNTLSKLDVRLPESMITVLENRLLGIELDSPLAKRRLERLRLRWDLARKLDELRKNITSWQSMKGKEKEDINKQRSAIKEFLKSWNLPDGLDTELIQLAEISANRDDVATGVADRRKQIETNRELNDETHKIFLNTSNQYVSISAGGGAFMLMDSAETERKEANFFLSSIKTRWSDAWSDVTELQRRLEEFQVKWEEFEAEKMALNDWIANAKRVLDDPNSTAEARAKLHEEMTQWRTRISALVDLGHELIGQCDISMASTLDAELSEMNQVWNSLSDQVSRCVEMNHVEQLKNQQADALHRINAMIKNTERLLNKDFVLPETTDLDVAHEATAAYRKQLENARAELLEKARLDYLQALRAAEELMRAAQNGQVDMAEAEAIMAAVQAAKLRLDQLANEDVPGRLNEVEAATQKAIELAIQLAPVNTWLLSSEMAEDLGNFETGELNLDFTGLSSDGALLRLQNHFSAIEQHERTLKEAEQRLSDLKAAGLKHMDVSQLELATAEARRKFELLRATARRCEQELERRRMTENMFKTSVSEVSQWLNEADKLLQSGSEAINKLSQQAVTTDVVKDVLDQHLEFFQKTQESGCAPIISLNRAYEKLMTLYNEMDPDEFGGMVEKLAPGLVTSTEGATGIAEAVSVQVQELRDHYDDVVTRSRQRQIELRYAMLESQLRDQLELMSCTLAEEESRIASGEQLSSILSDHESFFIKSDVSRVCEQLLNEMRELGEQMAMLDPESPKRLVSRTQQLENDFKSLTEHVGQLAVKLRNLPTQWADFEEKLYSLVDWTKEVEQLVRNLQANPDDVKSSDELTAMELAARYRAMLARFEELTGSSNEQGTLAENLNMMLADLSMQGGLSATELATKRAALAAAIGSLRDLRSEVDVVLDRAPLIAESLEYRASTVTEQRKAMVVRAAVEQAVQEDIEQLPTDLDAIRRLLAEREAMVARLAEERDASLAAMLQRGTAVKTSDLVDWIEPSENELRATWAEVDKYAEQSLIGLRQTADALEQFEGRKQRLTDLLVGTKHLIGGTASAAAAAALAMALHCEDGEMDPDAVCNALGIDESTRAWADASLASGVAGAIAASVEEATKAGQDSVRAQAEAVRAQLQAVQAAEADLVALKQAAETMKTRASAQRVAQIDETIARLEAELHKAKEDLNLRLSRLRSAEGKWEVCYTSFVEFDKFLNGAEARLVQTTDVQPLGIGAIQAREKGASESAALAAMAEVTGWSNTVEAELREVEAAAKRLMNLDSMFMELTSLDSINQFEGDTRYMSREVARAQAKLLGLHRRQDALLTAFQTHQESLKALTGHLNQFILLVPEFDNYISELEHLAESLNRSTIPESFDVFEKLRQEHTTRRAAHNSQWVKARDQLSNFAARLTMWPGLKEATEMLFKRWEVVNHWLFEEAQYLDEVYSTWTTWNREANELNSKLTNTEVELERSAHEIQEAEEHKSHSKEGPETKDGIIGDGVEASVSGMGDLDQHIARIRSGQERVQMTEALWKSLNFHTERLLRQLASQNEIRCRGLNEIDQSKPSSRRTSLFRRESQLSDSSVKGVKTTIATTSPHAVAVRFRELGERVRRLHIRWDKLNERVDSQLDVRDKLFRDLEKLAQWLAISEKRLGKLTRIWVVARPPLTSRPNDSSTVNSTPVQPLTDSVLKSTGDRRTEDTTAGLDLVEALNQLNTMYHEAKGPRFAALKEMAFLIEGEGVDLRTLASRGSSRPGSQHPTNDRPRPTGRLRSQRSVYFDVTSGGSERGSLEGNADEVNRVLRERLRRLANRLKRLFNRLSSRWFACNAALDYEHVRQVWRQQMDALDVRVKGLTSTADTVELKIPKKKRDTSARTTVEVDATQSADGLPSQDGKAASDLVENGDASNQQNELLSDAKEGLTPTRPSSEKVDDSEALLLEEQPVSSGQLYQQEYHRLKEEILDLKEVINSWHATQSVLEFKELEDKQVDEEEKVELEPKLLDTAAVSAGLMLVTSVDTNLSFGHNKDKPFSSTLQIEPFSFYVDTARFMVECDRLNGRMKANLVHVIAICESWQQLVDARDRIVEQASCLEQNACRICETICPMADPSESGRGVSMRLARLGRQLTDWQQSLLSSQDLLTALTTEEKQPAFPMTEPDQAAGSTNEASMIINRLRELQRLGDRLASIAPARGPTVHNLIIFAVQAIIRNANRLGELGRRTICLSEVLQKREQCINQVTQFLEAIGKQSGLELEKFQEQPFKNETDAVDAEKQLMHAHSQSQKSHELGEEAVLDIVETMDVATHLQVETSAEAKERLEKILAAESRLTCKQDTMLTQLHQVCIASWEAFREFNIEVNRGRPEFNQNDLPMTDNLRDGLLKRWSVLHNYLATARQQLEVRSAALSCVESGLQELENWLDPMEVLFDTCSSQLAAAACTAQSLSTLEKQGLPLPIQSNDLEVAENPQTLLTTYSSEIIYFENLVASLNCRVEADLADREGLINTLKTFDWRMDRLRKVATHLLAQWTEEGERCDQLQSELRQLASAVESTAVELNASCISCTRQDWSSPLLDLQSSAPSSELAFSKSLITQANREVYQFCGALAIRMRLDKFREHALRLHRRAQWLASGPSRYHNRLMQIRVSKESAEDRPKDAVNTENAEENAVNQILNSESKFCGGAVLLESEAVSLEHRLAGLVARAAKAAELKRRHVNQLYLDELRVWMAWQDEVQHGRTLVINHPFGLNVRTAGDQCGLETLEETLAKPATQWLVTLLTTHLSLIEDYKSRLSEGEKLVVDLKSMTFLMIRCSHLDRSSPQETSGEEQASPSSGVMSKESGVPVSLDELVSPTAEQLMQVMEQQMITIPIDGSEAETPKNLCLEVLEQLLVDHDVALRVINAGQTTLSDWSSELARLETHLNLALVEAKCADECEIDLMEQTVKLEQEFRQLSVWKELPSPSGCEQRLNDIQGLLNRVNDLQSSLRHAEEKLSHTIDLVRLAFSVDESTTKRPTSSADQNEAVSRPNIRSVRLAQTANKLDELKQRLTNGCEQLHEILLAIQTEQHCRMLFETWFEQANSEWKSIQDRHSSMTALNQADAEHRLAEIRKFLTEHEDGRSKLQALEDAVNNLMGQVTSTQNIILEPNSVDEQLMSSHMSIDTLRSIHTIGMAKYRERARQSISLIRNRLDAHLDIVTQTLNEAEIAVSRWDSWSNCELRLENWLSSVEDSWSPSVSSDHVSFISTLAEIKALVVLYKDRLQQIRAHEGLVETMYDQSSALIQRQGDTTDEKAKPPSSLEKADQLKTRFHRLKHQIQSTLTQYEERAEQHLQYELALEQTTQWINVEKNRLGELQEKWFSIIERLQIEFDEKTQCYFICDDLSTSILTTGVKKAPDDIASSLTTLINELKEFQQMCAVLTDTHRAKLHNLASVLIKDKTDEIDVRTLIAPFEANVTDCLIIPAQCMLGNATSISNCLDQLVTELNVVSHFLHKQTDTLNTIYIPVTKETARLQWKSRQTLPETQAEKLGCLTKLQRMLDEFEGNVCTRLFQSLESKQTDFKDVLRNIRSSNELSPRQIIYRCDRSVEKHVSDLSNRLIAMTQLTNSGLKFWQLAVNEQLRFENLLSSSQFELAEIEQELSNVSPDVGALSSPEDDQLEVHLQSIWSQGDKVYVSISSKLSDVLDELDRFQTTTYHNLLDIYRSVSLSTGTQGREEMSTELGRLKLTSDQLISSATDRRMQTENLLASHLVLIEEQASLQRWLDGIRHKINALDQVTSASPNHSTNDVDAWNFTNVWDELKEKRQLRIDRTRRIQLELQSHRQQIESFAERQQEALCTFKLEISEWISKHTEKKTTNELLNVPDLNVLFLSHFKKCQELLSHETDRLSRLSAFGEISKDALLAVRTVNDQVEFLLSDIPKMTIFSNVSVEDQCDSLGGGWTRRQIESSCERLEQEICTGTLNKADAAVAYLSEQASQLETNSPESKMALQLIDQLRLELTQLSQRVQLGKTQMEQVLKHFNKLNIALDIQNAWLNELDLNSLLATDRLLSTVSEKQNQFESLLVLSEAIAEHKNQLNEIGQQIEQPFNVNLSLVTDSESPTTLEVSEELPEAEKFEAQTYLWPPDPDLLTRLRTLQNGLVSCSEKVREAASKWKRSAERQSELMESLNKVEEMSSHLNRELGACYGRLFVVQPHQQTMCLPNKSLINNELTFLTDVFQPLVQEQLGVCERLIVQAESMYADTSIETMRQICETIQQCQTRLKWLDDKRCTFSASLIAHQERLEVTMKKFNRLTERLVENESASLLVCKQPHLSELNCTIKQLTVWRAILERYDYVSRAISEDLDPLLVELSHVQWTDQDLLVLVPPDAVTLSVTDKIEPSIMRTDIQNGLEKFQNLAQVSQLSFCLDRDINVILGCSSAIPSS
ncbi:hypothetical protein PHET_03405 [Paragonimus heterotremus]|uniref:Calponin-homology (CH) domain-containing protein n=1 Tax=Paragonimus heterotremus TaxID=100268 RepID=A0A8J4SP64_9TREM|nr:hypothetical protein PHET_03405 [Paragonimus heterotremus]